MNIKKIVLAILLPFLAIHSAGRGGRAGGGHGRGAQGHARGAGGRAHSGRMLGRPTGAQGRGTQRRQATRGGQINRGKQAAHRPGTKPAQPGQGRRNQNFARRGYRGRGFGGIYGGVVQPVVVADGGYYGGDGYADGGYDGGGYPADAGFAPDGYTQSAPPIVNINIPPQGGPQFNEPPYESGMIIAGVTEQEPPIPVVPMSNDQGGMQQADNMSPEI